MKQNSLNVSYLLSILFCTYFLHEYFATTLLGIPVSNKDKVLSYVITKYYICVNVGEYFLMLTSDFD